MNKMKAASLSVLVRMGLIARLIGTPSQDLS